MMYDYDLKGKTAYNWVTKVRMLLPQHGFGYVWANQGVGDVKGFLHVLKECLIDCRWQNCDEHVNTSERFSMYRNFMSSMPVMQKYLQLNIDSHVKSLMT